MPDKQPLHKVIADQILAAANRANHRPSQRGETHEVLDADIFAFTAALDYFKEETRIRLLLKVLEDGDLPPKAAEEVRTVLVDICRWTQASLPFTRILESFPDLKKKLEIEIDRAGFVKTRYRINSAPKIDLVRAKASG